MAHPYTTQARVQLFLGTDRLATLLDRDNDLVIDTGLMDDAIERVCNRIDASLGGTYVMPCAAMPSTPGSVSDLCDLGVGAMLYKWLAPKSADATTLHDDFEGEDGDKGQLGRYRDGTEVVLGLPLITDTATARRPLTYESAGTTFAGRINDDYSSSGTDKTAGFG